MQANVQQCQADINHLLKTSESLGLSMNADKCTVLRFKPRGNSIASTGRFPYHNNIAWLNFSASHSDLGVIVDTSLKFHANTNRNACIAGDIATNLLSSTLLRSQDFMLNIFISQIRPKMEYASCLWHTEHIAEILVLVRCPT